MNQNLAPGIPRIDWESIVGRPAPVIDDAAIRKAISSRRVLITGASGSLGCALSEFLTRYQPESLVMYDWHESSMFKLRQRLAGLFPGAPLRFVLGDVRNRQKIGRLMDELRPQAVFHLAAYKQLPWAEEDPAEFVSVNVEGAISLLDQSMRVGVEKFVYPSTDKAVETPSLYGATKKIVEEMLKASACSNPSLKCGIVRFVNVLGSQGSVSETFVKQAINGETFRITHEGMDRYWITPLEATLALTYASCLDDCARVVVPDAGEAILVTEIAKRIWNQAGKPGAEMKVDFIGLREGERLHEELAGPGETLEPAPYQGIVLVDDSKRRIPRPEEIRPKVENLLCAADAASHSEYKKMVLGLARSLA